MSVFSMDEIIARKEYGCACGRVHKISIDSIVVEDGALQEVENVVNRFGTEGEILVVCDKNTYEAAGRAVMESLKGHNTRLLMLEGQKDIAAGKVIANDTAVGRILLEVHEGVGLLLAVGSGSVIDSVRIVASRLGKPYIVVGTAPSMDGFASTVAPIVNNGFKRSYLSMLPHAILADTQVLKSAPMIMLGAGFGDIIGKYSALFDWRLSHIVTGEYLCPYTFDMVKYATDQCMQNADRIKNRDPQSMKLLMQSLVLTGLSMGFTGNSRPASGCEHHMAHLWEMEFLRRGGEQPLHGTKVGIAMVLVSIIHSIAFKDDLILDISEKDLKEFNEENWKKEMEGKFPYIAKDIIKENSGILPALTAAERIKQLERIKTNYAYIKQSSKELIPDYRELIDRMKLLQTPYKPAQIGVDRALLVTTLLNVQWLRSRYTLVDLLWRYGLLDRVAEEALAIIENI